MSYVIPYFFCSRPFDTLGEASDFFEEFSWQKRYEDLEYGVAYKETKKGSEIFSDIKFIDIDGYVKFTFKKSKPQSIFESIEVVPNFFLECEDIPSIRDYHFWLKDMENKEVYGAATHHEGKRKTRFLKKLHNLDEDVCGKIAMHLL